MGITRDDQHKRRKTGGKIKATHKKRKHAMGRPPASTKLGERKLSLVRCRYGIIKRRALRVNFGTFSWSSFNVNRSCRILTVSYSPANDKYVQANTIVKSSVVTIDATPFREWYFNKYGKMFMKGETDRKPSDRAEKRFEEDGEIAKLDPSLEEALTAGRLYAVITSRPGQSGRADGQVLEGKELDFYKKKLIKKKTK